jgi:hypothetical protein
MPPEIIRCPLCDVPHVAAAERCDSCGQPLRAPVDVGELEAELRARRSQLLLSVAAIAAMLALNWFLFGSAGGILLTAPIGWFLVAVVRWRKIRRFLSAQPPRAPQPPPTWMSRD